MLTKPHLMIQTPTLNTQPPSHADPTEVGPTVQRVALIPGVIHAGLPVLAWDLREAAEDWGYAEAHSRGPRVGNADIAVGTAQVGWHKGLRSRGPSIR